MSGAGGGGSLNLATFTPTAVQVVAALHLVDSGRFDGVPDVDDALMNLPPAEVATVMYCVERGYVGDEELKLTDSGRHYLAALDPKES